MNKCEELKYNNVGLFKFQQQRVTERVYTLMNHDLKGALMKHTITKVH